MSTANGRDGEPTGTASHFSERISVVVAEHFPLLLRGIASLFKAESDIFLKSAVANGDDAIYAIRQHTPDVAVLGLHMPGKGALEVLEALAGEELKTRMVILAGRVSDDELLQARLLRVRGIVLLNMPESMLARCVRLVHAGVDCIEGGLSARHAGKAPWQSAMQKKLPAPLTARESAVVEHVIGGLSNKQIARQLGLTEGTVKSHLHRVYFKLHVRGRYALLKGANWETLAAAAEQAAHQL